MIVNLALNQELILFLFASPSVLKSTQRDEEPKRNSAVNLLNRDQFCVWGFVCESILLLIVS